MDEKQQSMSGQQSLHLIRAMIQRAKGDIQNASFYFLMWGWIIFAGSIGHYLLLEFSNAAHPEWAWSIIAVGLIASFVQGFRDRKKAGSTTYAARIYTWVWITFLINYFIMLFFIEKINYYITPLVLVMVAAATFLSGIILKFGPLKWGALFIWAMGITAFMVALPYQLLATAAAVLVGYLIPGYLLQKNQTKA